MHSCNALALELNCALMNVAADRREKDMHALAERHGFRTPWQVSKSTPPYFVIHDKTFSRVEWIPAETERGFTNLYNEGSWDGIFFLLKTAQNLETSIS